MLEGVKNWFDRGRSHENVGRIFYSEYFEQPIVVTAYKSDNNWRFRFYEKDHPYFIKAQSPLSYFIAHGFERKDLPWDNMNKLEEYR